MIPVISRLMVVFDWQRKSKERQSSRSAESDDISHEGDRHGENDDDGDGGNDNGNDHQMTLRPDGVKANAESESLHMHDDINGHQVDESHVSAHQRRSNIAIDMSRTNISTMQQPLLLNDSQAL